MQEYYDYNQSYHRIAGVFTSKDEAQSLAAAENAKQKKNSHYEWSVIPVALNKWGDYWHQ